MSSPLGPPKYPCNQKAANYLFLPKGIKHLERGFGTMTYKECYNH